MHEFHYAKEHAIARTFHKAFRLTKKYLLLGLFFFSCLFFLAFFPRLPDSLLFCCFFFWRGSGCFFPSCLEGGRLFFFFFKTVEGRAGPTPPGRTRTCVRECLPESASFYRSPAKEWQS